jgi:hypothetical protein
MFRVNESNAPKVGFTLEKHMVMFTVDLIAQAVLVFMLFEVAFLTKFTERISQ